MKLSKPLLITKLKATGVHLSMSLLVFVYLAYEIYFNWYPQPYFAVDGGWQGIRLVGAVDLILGPLITFLIFDLRKSRKEILFDLTIIAMFQFGALAYGVHATYNQRPLAIVLYDEYVVTAIDEHYADSLSSEDVLRQYSDEQPPIIYARLDQTREAIDEILRIKNEDKVLEHAQIHLYQPRSELAKVLRKRQPRIIERLDHFKANDSFEDWLRQNQESRENVMILRFTGRYGAVWLVFDQDGKNLGYF